MRYAQNTQKLRGDSIPVTAFHYTINAYGKDVEPGVPEIGESMETLIELSKIVGK